MEASGTLFLSRQLGPSFFHSGPTSFYVDSSPPQSVKKVTLHIIDKILQIFFYDALKLTDTIKRSLGCHLLEFHRPLTSTASFTGRESSCLSLGRTLKGRHCGLDSLRLAGRKRLQHGLVRLMRLRQIFPSTCKPILERGQFSDPVVAVGRS